MDKSSITKFGTAPVFFTAISTILGAILFLRFGFAVGTIGLWGVILIIVLGHMVTIPTALAISELATNKRVEGGGEYFIISRSFGLNIGATIGIALYMSQAISVAFYVIAFTEAFEPLFNWVKESYGLNLPRQVISIPAMTLLAVLILKKGANLGVKALYVVVAILFISLGLFLFGSTEYGETTSLNIFSNQLRNTNQFFVVFAIIFPAFTGMTAGVGLSGDLKDPSKSIPIGTIAATIVGLIIYVFVVLKLTSFASIEDLLNRQLVMGDIAIAGWIVVPIGLAASTISSAIGSFMVAPRTLQALALDRAFPKSNINKWIGFSRKKDGEPINASIITVIIAFFFVAMGNVNSVATIISMFFMVTYGSLCLISFLNHFGSSPSYRPSFRSRWYLSLIGFVISLWVMFKIDTLYAFLAFCFMALIYSYLDKYHKSRKGFDSLFLNTIFQLSRNMHVFVQKNVSKHPKKEWRPSVVCVSDKPTDKSKALDFLNWISYKYGFATYLHFIDGYFSKITSQQAASELSRIINNYNEISNHVYIDTIISPSYTSAISQALQIPSITGMPNNMLIFETSDDMVENEKRIIENIPLVNAGNFDLGIISNRVGKINYSKDIHLWIKSNDTENANLIILLSFIIYGHPVWKKSKIKIFDICKEGQYQETKFQMQELISNGRLPITSSNIQIIEQPENVASKTIINQKSADSALAIIGFRIDSMKHNGMEEFMGYDNLKTILFVNSHSLKVIE